jgi:hypothetical protein
LSLFNKLNQRTLFIVLYGTVFLLFAIPYVIHLSKLASAAGSISIRESKEKNEIEYVRKELRATFVAQFPEQELLFDQLYEPIVARLSRDTLIQYFIYSNTLSIHSYDLGYTDCASNRIHSEAMRIRADKSFEKKIVELEKKHGSHVRSWANKIGKKRFYSNYRIYDCTPHYKGIEEYELNMATFDDFDKFLVELERSKAQAQQERYRVQREYEERIARIKSGLSDKEKSLLNRQLDNNSVIRDGSLSFQFNGSALGSFEYSLPSKVIDEKILEDAMAIVYNELYRNNSLANGSMPYAYCYGKNNSGNSSVRVNAGNGDVLVMIKNTSDKVIRHVYVKANNGFTLRVPNGSYSVHFYHGTGWNPKKNMKDAYCGPIVGGFIYYEALSKDPERLHLYNQSMSYTLRTVTGGNFSTVPSSVGEAF